MAGLTSIGQVIPGQSTTTLSSTLSSTTSIPSSRTASVTSSAVLSSTHSSVSPFRLYSEKTITNGVLPTNLYCVLHPSPLPEDPYAEPGLETAGPSHAVGVTPVNEKSWPQIVNCCGSQNITIYDYYGVCVAWCPASITALNTLYHCYDADPRHLLPEFDETICNDCPDETTTSAFSHSEIYASTALTASRSATTTASTAVTTTTSSAASAATTTSAADRPRGLAAVITTVMAVLALASLTML